MLKQLVQLADHLDKIGLTKEANQVDQIIQFASRSRWTPSEMEEYINTSPRNQRKMINRNPGHPETPPKRTMNPTTPEDYEYHAEENLDDADEVEKECSEQEDFAHAKWLEKQELIEEEQRKKLQKARPYGGDPNVWPPHVKKETIKEHMGY